METADRREIATFILSLFRQKRIECMVLHGMEGGEIGRDLDVWIPKRFWKCVSAEVMSLGRERGWNPVRTLGPFGLRFLFFTDSSVCGTLELHCVRDLDWFYVKSPDDVLSLHPYKRFFMTLATGQIDKVRYELSREPLSDDEKSRLGSFLRKRGIFGPGGLDRFWHNVEAGNLDSASINLRHSVLAKAALHPFAFAKFLSKRLGKAVWMFARPAGVCLFLVSDDVDADTIAKAIDEKKGVLVEVEPRDFRRLGFVRSLFAFMRLRLAQGHQKAFIVSIFPWQRSMTRLVFLPAFHDARQAPVQHIAETLKDILVFRSCQFEKASFNQSGNMS